MVKIAIEYENFDGENTQENVYFNLNRRELIELVNSKIDDVPFNEYVKILEDRTKNDKKAYQEEALKFLDYMMERSYGERSEDGKRFMKKDEKGVLLYEYFKNSLAYDAVLNYIVSSPERVIGFITNIISGVQIPGVKEAINKINNELSTNGFSDNIIDILNKANNDLANTNNKNNTNDQPAMNAPLEEEI